MQYLIKLKDRENGRETLVECPANMSLEELSIKIKIELQLPYYDKGIHCFLFHGKVYVPDYTKGFRDFEGVIGDYQKHLDHPKMPSDKDYRSCEQSRLKKVFTVKGSTIVYCQALYLGLSTICSHIECTLLERIM